MSEGQEPYIEVDEGEYEDGEGQIEGRYQDEQGEYEDTMEGEYMDEQMHGQYEEEPMEDYNKSNSQLHLIRRPAERRERRGEDPAEGVGVGAAADRGRVAEPTWWALRHAQWSRDHHFRGECDFCNLFVRGTTMRGKSRGMST